MNTNPPTDVDRIPLAHSVRYVVRGLPEVPNMYGDGVLIPSEITLTYRAAPDSQLGRVHAYVAGRIWVDGKELPLLPGGLYGQHYDDGVGDWPEWLAEEARRHDPAVPVSSPPPDQTAEPDCKFEEGCHRVVPCDPGCGAPLPDQTRDRDRYAEVTAAARAEANRLALSESLGLGTGTPWAAIRERVAALAVLPPPADQAAVLLEAADRLWALANRTTERGAGVLWAADWLRRLAAEAPQPDTETRQGSAETETLADIFEGFGRLLATSSRDWGQYAPDAWLYAVICGWDCEEPVHDETCTHGAMEEMQQRHGWDDEAVAKARRYRAAVRALTAAAGPGRAADTGDEEADRG